VIGVSGLGIDLPVAWAGIIVLAVVMYVLLDGFDLGVGILFPYAPGDPERDVMMTSVAPIWDANETWLVLGGAALFGAFPLAYSVILSGAYLPLLIMLIALILRGVAFEFRFKAARSRPLWDKAFHYGSVLATFAQGLVLGAFIQGFKVEGRVFAGGPLDFLTPFSVLTGIALIFGYGLLGAGWLVLKTEDDIQVRARRYGRVCLAGVVIGIVVVSLWTPLANDAVFSRWFSWPNILILSPVPVATALVAWATWRALGGASQSGGFIGAVGLFALSYIGITISLWPMIVPHHYTLTQAASPPGTQAFLLVGTLFLLPVIFFYSGWSYWVFRGKVRADVGYH